jgi:hypothetical protein
MSELPARVWRIPIFTAPLPWSLLAGAGAAFFAHAAVLIVFTILYGIFGITTSAPLPRAVDLANAVAIGVGVGIAYVSGGRPPAVAYAALLVLERLVALGSQGRYCAAIEPTPFGCTFIGSLLGLWPYVLGGALAYMITQSARGVSGDRNPVLEVAGALHLARIVVFGDLAFVFASSSEFQGATLQVIGAVAVGLACGAAVLRRIELQQQWRMVAIVGMVSLGEWLIVSIPAFLSQVGVGGRMAIGGLGVASLFSPLLEIGAVALTLYIAAARRVTSAPAT